MNSASPENCRRFSRIAAKIAKRGEEVLCRTIHPPTGAEDVEWLEESEVPQGIPEEVSTSTECNDLPVVSDWATWIANPFSPKN